MQINKKKNKFYWNKLIFNWDSESQLLVNSFVVNTFIILFVLKKIIPFISSKFLTGFVIFCLLIYILSYLAWIFDKVIFKEKEKTK